MAASIDGRRSFSHRPLRSFGQKWCQDDHAGNCGADAYNLRAGPEALLPLALPVTHMQESAFDRLAESQKSFWALQSTRPQGCSG